MTEHSQYTVRWKGKESEPLSLQTIQHKLSSGEFSLMHEVYFQGEWITLERFLKNTEQSIHEPAWTPHPIPSAAPSHDSDLLEENDDAESSNIHFILILAGYACAIAALFFYPPILGMTAFMIGSLNIVLKNYGHGSLQICLSLICYYVGFNFLAFTR